MASAPYTKRSSQEMESQSFDETFNQNTVEILGYDSTNNVLRRANTDTSGNLQVSQSPNTTNGTLTYSANGGTGNALLTNSAVQAGTAAAHSVYGWNFVNTGTLTTYVQVFDSVAANVTLGVTVPKLVLWVPAGGAWEEKFSGEGRVAFTNGIAVAATTTTTGSTAPATGINANINYL